LKNSSSSSLLDRQQLQAARSIAAIAFATKVKNQGVTTWVMPKLVAETKSTEWTTAGEMRHPVFRRLRTDKHAGDVVLERELKRRPK
jgi:ATP-dependent DNA ligase